MQNINEILGANTFLITRRLLLLGKIHIVRIEIIAFLKIFEKVKLFSLSLTQISNLSFIS